MTDTENLNETIKRSILNDPAVVLDNPEVMRALLESTDKSKGDNVMDLRGVFVARLEERLDRLEDAHRTVIAAAYENLTGTNQIHRAIIALLSADTLSDFVQILNHDVANILGVDIVRLCIEGDKPHGSTTVDPANPQSGLIIILPTDGVANYITGQRNGPNPKQVTLRSAREANATVFGNISADIMSEAMLRLDIGGQSAGGVVVFGSYDPKRFSSDQGTELLAFFTQSIERILPRLLA